MNIIHLDQLKKHAAHAADNNLGPQANHFPPDSEAHAEWLKHYYARVQALAIEVAA